jgi:hypothetical protein
MLLDLNTLGEAAEHMDLCEQAIADGNFSTARDELEQADIGLDAVREQWKASTAAQRPIIARMAKPASDRRTALAARIPAKAVISEGAAEPDQDDDDAPELGSEPAAGNMAPQITSDLAG